MYILFGGIGLFGWYFIYIFGYVLSVLYLVSLVNCKLIDNKSDFIILTLSMLSWLMVIIVGWLHIFFICRRYIDDYDL